MILIGIFFSTSIFANNSHPNGHPNGRPDSRSDGRSDGRLEAVFGGPIFLENLPE